MAKKKSALKEMEKEELPTLEDIKKRNEKLEELEDKFKEKFFSKPKKKAKKPKKGKK